ncbi:MAG TPA: PA2779 family protein [Burkholderiales bacterium]|nr:PA2779 family protein [Burkholderiales bacterium]
MNRFRRIVAAVLVFCIAGPGFLPGAQAAMLSTEAALPGERGRVSAFLERAEVRAKLEAYGVRAEDVKDRVASMTDDEAKLVAAHIDELPAGGVVGLILTIFLVLLITDILGLTKVFPFTKPICDRGRC